MFSLGSRRKPTRHRSQPASLHITVLPVLATVDVDRCGNGFGNASSMQTFEDLQSIEPPSPPTPRSGNSSKVARKSSRFSPEPPSDPSESPRGKLTRKIDRAQTFAGVGDLPSLEFGATPSTRSASKSGGTHSFDDVSSVGSESPRRMGSKSSWCPRMASKASTTFSDASFLERTVSMDDVETKEQTPVLWHVMLLGRTFRDKTCAEVANCLADVLELSFDEASQKAASANESRTLVVGTYNDCAEADMKAQALRCRGLRVQVASEAGLPGAKAPISPTSPRRSRTQSLSDVSSTTSPNSPQRLPSSPPISGRKMPSYEALFRVADGNSPRTRSKKSTQDFSMKDSPKVKPQEILSLKGMFDLELPSAMTRQISNCSQQSALADDDSKHAQTDDAYRYGSEGAAEQVHIQTHLLQLNQLQASALLHFVVSGEIREPATKRCSWHASTDAIGTKDEVKRLWQFWQDMDADGSNDIDHVEFNHHIGQLLQSRLLALSTQQTLPKWGQMTAIEKTAMTSEKYMGRLCDELARYLFDKKSTFASEDLMKLKWPRASETDFQSMQKWFSEMHMESTMINAPPVVAPNVYAELCALFRHYDQDDVKHFTFQDLVTFGLIDKDNVEETRRMWDADGNGVLDMEEFCEMMCPTGHRASTHSKVAMLTDGRRVVLDPSSSQWRVD